MTETKTLGNDMARTTRHRRHAVLIAAALVAATAAGAGATALVKGRTVTLVSIAPQLVATLKDGNEVAVKGEAAEIFGNKFVVQDGTGRALVETGRRGEGARLVTKGEAVTVQGRFDGGFLRAAAITHADGHVDAIDPPPPPPPGLGPDAREAARPPA